MYIYVRVKHPVNGNSSDSAAGKRQKLINQRAGCINGHIHRCAQKMTEKKKLYAPPNPYEHKERESVSLKGWSCEKR